MSSNPPVDSVNGLQQLSQVLAISSTLSHDLLSMSPEEFLARIADHARELLSAAVCILWKLNEETHTLKVAATSGPVDDEYKRLQLDPGARQMAFLSEPKPRWLRDVSKPHALYQHAEYAKERGWVSLRTMPMLAGTRLIGLLDTYTTVPREFQLWERNALMVFGNFAALCLWTQSLQAEKVIKLYDDIGSTADPRGICERVIQRNVDELGANAGHIRLLDNRTNELLFVAGKGAYRHFAPLKKSLGSDISGKVAATGDLYYGPFLENERHLQRLKADSRLLTRRAESYQAFLAEITSELTLPFRIDNTFYGLVTLYGTEPNHAPTVTASDVDDFFQQALEDLRLSKPIEPHNLGRLIHFTIDLESNVRRQLQHSLDIFHAYTAHIRLYDRNRGELVYLAGRGAVQYFASRRPRKHLGEDVFTEVVVSGKPRFVPNLESDPHFARFQALYRSECESGRIERNPEFEEFLQRAKSELIVPLRIPAPHGDIIGCAAMTSERPGRSFDRKARKDFQDLINQVSGAFAAVTKHTGVAVSDLITFSTNSRHAFREALRSLIARSRPLAKWGHIRIIDADSRQLTLYVCVGPHEHFAAPEVPLEDVPMYRGVIDAGADYRVTDLQRQPHFARMLDDHQARRQNLNEYLAYLDSVRSELVAPLKVEDRMIGTATVQSYRADAFRYAECGFFANSMKYAAVLIENSQLSQSIEQLQTLIKNSASPQLPRLLSHLARSAVELLGADIVAIYEYQSETKSFSLPATIEGVLIRPHLTERSIRADRVPGVMVKTGEPFICPDASLIGAKLGVPELLAGRARSRGFVARERIESAAGFPLTVQEEPVGVMFFNFRNPQSFSESRKQLMRIFASEASIAIRNARLHKKALEKDLRLKGLMGAYDLERDLHQILSQAAEVFAADSGHIRLLDHDSGRLKKVVAVGEQFLRVKEEVEWGEPIAGYLLDQPSPIIVRNAEEGPFQIPQHPDLRHTNPSLYDFLRKVRSYACLPLLESEKVVGTLCLASERIGTFDDSKRKALEEYCEMAVNAVHKSRVYRQALAESAELKDKIDRYYELASLLDEDYGIDKKIALILTAITMRGGLEFNRALLFLKDDNENTLTLRYGIGPRDEMDAKSIYADEIWTDLGEAKSPLRELCERGRLEEFVHRDAGFLGRKGTIAVALKDQTQWLVKALHEHNSVLVRRPDLSSGDVLADIAAREFILTPLGTSADPIGVLYVDNKYTQRSGDLKRDFLQLYADRAKEAIQQARQHRREILNPFIFTHPTTLQDKNVFAGRSDVIRQLEQAFLGTARPPTVLLHGAKRMGKTSILCQLPRLLGPDFAPVTVDCQEPSITDGPATLVKYLSNRIREGLRMRAVQIHTLEPDAKRPYAVFDRWLDTVEARLPERMRVLLCLDEYEMLAAGLTKGWGAQFLDALRHILQHRYRLLLLFSGGHTFTELGPEWTNRFIGTVRVKVSFLDPDDVKVLLKQPTPEFDKTYEPEALETVIKATGCQPLLTQAVAFQLFDLLKSQQRSKASPSDIEEAIERALTASEEYFINIWNDAGEGGRRILTALAAESIPPDLPDAWSRLRDHDVLDASGRITVPMVQRWIRQRLHQFASAGSTVD